jgi:Methyltransferase domain
MVGLDSSHLLQTPATDFTPRRYAPGGIANWSRHLPFAYDLVALLRPARVVELGTHFGESYFGLCQSVLENDVRCRCFAVDTWKGDRHSGFYGEEVFEEVDAYNRAHYSAFSTLLRCTFEEALSDFDEQSIDLLHIDGLHTYEAVSQEFRSWLPKVKPGGVILLHDIVCRGDDFGVWKFWEEISARFESFEFHHHSGLGVLRVPGPPLPDHPFFRGLFERDSSSERRSQDTLRNYYVLLSHQLDNRPGLAPPQNSRSVWVTVYPFVPPGYGETTALSAPLRARQWERLTFDLPNGSQGPIRIDPAQEPAALEIAEIRVRAAAGDRVLWRAGEAEGFDEIQPTGDIVALSQENGCLRCFSFGADPHLILPDLPRDATAQPLLVDILLKADTEISGLVGMLNTGLLTSPPPNQISSPAQQLFVVPQKQISNLRNEIVRLRDERDSLAANVTSLDRALHEQRRQIADFRSSYSWRFTKPLRWAATRLLGRPRPDS